MPGAACEGQYLLVLKDVTVRSRLEENQRERYPTYIPQREGRPKVDRDRELSHSLFTE